MLMNIEEGNYWLQYTFQEDKKQFYLGLNRNNSELGFETYRDVNSSYVFIESIQATELPRQWTFKQFDKDCFYIYTEDQGRYFWLCADCYYPADRRDDISVFIMAHSQKPLKNCLWRLQQKNDTFQIVLCDNEQKDLNGWILNSHNYYTARGYQQRRQQGFRVDDVLMHGTNHWNCMIHKLQKHCVDFWRIKPAKQQIKQIEKEKNAEQNQIQDACIKVYLGDQDVPDFKFGLQPGASLTFKFGKEFLQKLNLQENEDIINEIPKPGRYYIKFTNNENKDKYLSLNIAGLFGKETFRTEKSNYLYVGPEKTTVWELIPQGGNIFKICCFINNQPYYIMAVHLQNKDSRNENSKYICGHKENDKDVNWLITNTSKGCLIQMADKGKFYEQYIEAYHYYGYASQDSNQVKHCDFVFRDSTKYQNCYIHKWTDSAQGFYWKFEPEQQKSVLNSDKKVSLLNQLLAGNNMQMMINNQQKN